ncbi:hypothetical protein [Paraglaciecola arctica]|uniref:Uncharacterized protein n=1 Tax=Paraglaciecola arctica BSs20135 TaxID=493475 RepID=K6YSD4_9ALTE|nr:hypothetical protein [Paraglaciecola arctica]GAC19603.1 hypothetical protein GARC_2637 [Paraglaciecola arctica BSs20135]
MKAKGGKSINAVAPANPVEAFEADDANPGKVAEVKAKEIEKKQGKYGSTVVPPFKPLKDQSDEEKQENTSWVEFELLDEEDSPVPGEKYEIELPDGKVAKGTLDGDGFARIDGIKPGECKVCFPEYDKESWYKA